MSSNSDGKTFNTDITADPSNFEAGVKKATKAAVDASDTINAQFKKVGDTFGMVTKYFAGFTAVLAGGGALKKFISDANEWNGEAGKMGRQLAITTEKASVLNVALSHLGVGSDVFLSASEKMSKQIHGNAQAFEVLGIKTRDVNGAYRPVTELMGEVNQKLAAIKNPIEQNIAGQQVYGKGWSEVRGILKVTADQMAQAEVRARELGLVVGPDGAAMSKQYNEQMRDLALVGKSLEVQFGNALLPIFTKTGAFLGQAGPVAASVFREVLTSVGSVISTVYDTASEFVKFVWSGFSQLGEIFVSVFGGESIGAMDVFRNVLKLVEVAAVGLSTAFKLVGEAIHAQLDFLVGQFLRFGDAGLKALKLDFSGAKAAWVAGGQVIEQAAAEHQQRLIEIAKAGGEKINNIIMRPASAPAAPKTRTGNDDEPDPLDFNQNDGKNQSRMGDWEAQLADKKAALERQGLVEGQYREMSKAEELKYWQYLKAMRGLSDAEKLALQRKTADTELAMIKQTFEVRVAALEAEGAAYKNNTGERLRIELQLQGMYQKGTKEYEQSQKRVVEIQRQAAEQERAISTIKVQAGRDSALQQIALEEQSAQQAAQLGLLSQQQQLASQAQFEDRRNAIARDALAERLTMAELDADKNKVLIEQLNQEIEQLERQHQLRMGQIKGAMQLDNLTPLVNVFKGAETAISGAIQGILTRTMSLRQALASIWKGISQSVITEISAMLAKKVAAWAVERTMAVAGIGANAAKAGSGAAASQSSIPYVGPILAIAAMAAVFAGVMAMKSNVPSAAGGYDIPSSINPLTQLHAKEMVLPAKYADVVRQAADGGPSQASAPDMHLHVHATDAESVRRLLLNNSSAVADAMKKAYRDFQFTGARV